MTDHDHLFKELLTAFFVEFLELFCPDVLHYMDTSTIEPGGERIAAEDEDGEARPAQGVADQPAVAGTSGARGGAAAVSLWLYQHLPAPHEAG